MLAASAILPLGTGLMATWSLHTPLSKLISYSALAGFGAALGCQAPQTAVQTVLSDSDGPLGLSVILFAQHFGPALSISLAQTIFTNRLAKHLEDLVPGLSARSINELGLGEITASAGPEKMTAVLKSINESLVEAWYLPLGMACVLVIGSLMMEWRSVKEKKS
jgi:hypothetical protein